MIAGSGGDFRVFGKGAFAPPGSVLGGTGCGIDWVNHHTGYLELPADFRGNALQGILILISSFQSKGFANLEGFVVV